MVVQLQFGFVSCSVGIAVFRNCFYSNCVTVRCDVVMVYLHTCKLHLSLFSVLNDWD